MRNVWMRGALVCGVAAAVWGMSELAWAQDPLAGNGKGMDTHLFRPAMDSKGLFATNGSDILGANDISFGLVIDYADILLRDTPMGQKSDQLINTSLQGTFQFNYGIANILVAGLDLPVILMTNDAAKEDGMPVVKGWGTEQLNAQNLEYLGLHGKLRILRVEHGFGLAVGIQLGVPVTDAPQQAGADPGFFYWPQLMLERRLGSRGQFKIMANAGYRGHITSDTSLLLRNGEYVDGNLFTYGGGFAWRVLPAVDIIGETYGTYLLNGDAGSSVKPSNEAVGGIKVFVERNSYLMLGAGGRYTQGFEAANIRGFIGFIFEPSIGDRDGDGIKDDVDQCPDEPEDRDGFQDEDGCPEESDGDRDGDGILDSKDKCPDVPEDRDGFEDEDGCPDPD